MARGIPARAGAEFSVHRSAGGGVDGSRGAAQGLCRGWHPGSDTHPMGSRVVGKAGAPAGTGAEGGCAMSRDRPNIRGLNSSELRLAMTAAKLVAPHQRDALMEKIISQRGRGRDDFVSIVNWAVREAHAAASDDDAA